MSKPNLPLHFVFLLVLAVAAYAMSQDSRKSDDSSGKPSTLRVDSGTLLTADGVPIQLHRVVAQIIAHHQGASQDKGKSDNSDDPPKSEVVNIQTGTVILSSDSLTRLLNKKVGKNGKLSDLKFSTDPKKNQVHISGKAKKLIDIPFDLQGPVKATDDGKIELDAQSVKAADIPGLAGLLGLTVQKAAGKDAAKGVKTEHNTIIFNPDQLWGLPVHGSVTKVTVQQKGIMLAFGTPGQTPSSSPTKAHMQKASTKHK